MTSAIINTIGSGPAIQETTSSRLAPIMRTMAQRNHSVSGTRAIEVTRCIHQWVAPALAEPRPRARPSAERMMSTLGGCAMPASPDRDADDPEQQRRDGGRDHHRPGGA